MKDITVSELKDRLDKGEQVNLLDVREEWEFDEDNLEGKLIPLPTLPQSLDQLSDWKDQELIVHCRSGKRSEQAKKYLQSQGYTQVRNLLGGILAYREQ